MSREVKSFAVKEFHRGKWIPILSKEEGKPRVISISVENAEMMNLDAEAGIKEKGRTSLFGYFPIEDELKKEVKDSDDSDINTLRDEYKELYGKKAYAGWGADKLKEKIEAKK